MKKLVLVSIVFVITSLLPAAMVIDAPDTIEQGSTVNLAIVIAGPTLDFSGTVWVNQSTNNAAGDALSNVILFPDPVIPPAYPDLPDSFTFDLNNMKELNYPVPKRTWYDPKTGTGVIVRMRLKKGRQIGSFEDQ